MRRSMKAALVAAAAVAGTTIGMTSFASASSSTTVLHATDKLVQATSIDLGKKGFSQGDKQLFTSDVYQSGSKVGTVGGECTVVRTKSPTQLQCVITASVHGSQLTIQGIFTDMKTNTFAITGGTGVYKDAGGYGKVTSTSSTTESVVLYIDNLEGS